VYVLSQNLSALTTALFALFIGATPAVGEGKSNRPDRSLIAATELIETAK
jgi:hypothetical protein